MLTTLAKLPIVLLVCHLHLGHTIILESVYQKYLIKQGLQFRENIFLGNKPILSEYDFVIIGGGVAGSVMANRLSENPKWKVLLLESGEDENIYTNIPLLAHFNSLTHFNWKYKLERNTNHSQCLAMYNDQCPCPRGKGLGGSSILNYMIYTRGNKKDYEAYEAAGNKGWGYDDVLKYFLKSENNTSEFLDPDSHSHGGPLKVTNIPYPNLLTEKFTQATCELGYSLYDYTGKDPATEGFSKLQATISQGQRVSANRAYLKTVKHRTSKNLHISIFSHVTRILIDPNTKRAHGVEFHKNGVKRVVLAKKEVILSAGAIGSPQILMLSGVGPEEHLKDFDINVASNLRGVGQNMHDHHSFFGLTFLVNRTNTGSTIEKNVVTMDQFLKWLKLGRGPLAVPGGVTGIGYMNTKYNIDKSYPDTEYLFTVGSFNSDGGRIFRKSMNLRKDMYDSVYRNINNREVWSIIPVVLRPKTRGYVQLKSKNPFKYPRINYDFFQYEEDADIMLEGIKNVIKMSETEAFQSIGSQIHKTPIPDCAHFEFGCDDYWRCAMKYFTSSLYHQSGTCKMGPEEDQDAVVNYQLQVYGVTHLRVVDASIFPAVPSAHLYAPTVMVAEKASDMIKETWRNTEENDKHPNSGCFSHPTSNEDSSDNLNKTPCNSNSVQETSTTDSYNKPTDSTTTSSENTSSETTPDDNGPVVPNQPDIFSGWETSSTNPTSTTTEEFPYEVTQTTTSTTEKSPPTTSNNGHPYSPQNSVSTYPPYIPNQPYNGYPTPLNNNMAGSTTTFTNSQYQQNNGYPAQAPFQQQTNQNYVQSQFPAQNQLNAYANQSSASQGSNTAYYPSDNYQIHTVYPGSGPQNNQYPSQAQNNIYPSQAPNNIYPSQAQNNIYPSQAQNNIYPSQAQNNNYPSQAYNPQVSPYNPSNTNNFQTFPTNVHNSQPPFQQGYYPSSVSQSTQNIYPSAQTMVPPGVQYPQVPMVSNPGHAKPSYVSNEIVSPNEDIMFPNNKHGKRPVQHSAFPAVTYADDEPNYSGLTSLSNIPYYNQHLQKQQGFEPNPFSGNRSQVPAAIFINPELLFELQRKYLSKRSAGRRNRRLKDATTKPTEVTEQNVVTREVPL